MQTFTGPDGQDYDFPDEMSQDAIKGVFQQKFGGPNAGAGGSPTPVPAAGSGAASQPNPPSYASQLVGQLAKPLRQFNQGLLGGWWDPAVGAAKTALFGGSIGQNVAQEQAQTKEAGKELGPGASIALQAGGALAGPGKLMRAAGAPSAIARVIGSGAESGILSGSEALAQGQPTLPAVAEGAAIGTVLPTAIEGVGKIASKFPGMRPPIPVTSADLTDPTKMGGYTFISNADRAKAGKLSVLENMENNVQYGSDNLGSQVNSLFRKNVDTGEAPIDSMNFSPAEKDALTQVGKVGPVSSFMVQHPRVTQGAIGAIGEVPAMLFGLHGNLPAAIASEALATAGHVGAATMPFARRAAVQQAALDNAKRVIAGQSTTGAAQDWLNNPNINRTLWNLIANRSATQ